MKTFYVHIQLGTDSLFGETVVPVMAENLDAAHEWADEQYGQHGIEVTRIRPKV